MKKKRWILLGALAGLIILASIPPYYYLPEKVFVDDAEKAAYSGLQEFAKAKGIRVEDFWLSDIKRGCCADGYDYHMLFCHRQYSYQYNSFMREGGGAPLKKGEVCRLDPNLASQYSAYLKN